MGTFYKELGKKKPWELWPRPGPITEALNVSITNQGKL